MNHPAISPRTEKWIRLSAIACMLLVAISAVVLSFDGLWNLAVENRVPEHLAFLFPIIIDGTITMSSLAILRMNLGGRKATFGWCVMFLGVALSIAGNAISVADAGVIAMLVHALPPLLLAISLELLLSLIRANIKAAIAEEEKRQRLAEAGDAAPAAPAPLSDEKPETDSAAEELAAVAAPQVLAPAVGAGDISLESPGETLPPRAVEVPVVEKDLSASAVDQIHVPAVEEVQGVEEPEVVAADEAPVTEEIPPADVVDAPDETVLFAEEDDSVTETEMDIDDDVAQNDEPSAPAEKSAPVETGDRVEAYRRVVAAHPEWSRRKKILAIMVNFPEAEKDVNNIKRALGDKLNVSYREDLAVARAHLEKLNRKN